MLRLAATLGGAATGLVKGGFDAATGVPKDASAFGWLRFLSTEEPTAVALPLLLALPMGGLVFALHHWSTEPVLALGTGANVNEV